MLRLIITVLLAVALAYCFNTSASLQAQADSNTVKLHKADLAYDIYKD